MAETMILPPDPRDTDVAFAVPAALAPYLRAMFNDTKREGDTVDAFLLRIIATRAAEYVLQKRSTEVRTTAETKSVVDDAAMREEFAAIVGTI